MTVKLLTEQHLEFLSLNGRCTGSYESTLVKMPHCWKSHAMAQMKKIKIHLASQSKRRILDVLPTGLEMTRFCVSGYKQIKPINKFSF